MLVRHGIRDRRAASERWFLAGAAIFAVALFPVATCRAQSAVNTPVQHRNNTVFHTQSVNPHARDFYQLVWGIDKLNVKSVESGEMIRFSYLVLDEKKAAQLNDKKATPCLIDERAHVKLVVPTMEKVGQLRQSSQPQTGRSYWMVFSNKGRMVKSGDSVSVVIGSFQVNGLVVQ
jgi:hypothetical protein